MYVNIGELKQRIKIMSIGSEVDDDGYPVSSRETVHDCPAKATRTSGTEIMRGNADFSDTTMRFLIRYTTKAIDRKMVIEYRGAEYEILYINDYEDAHHFIEIIAQKLAVT